MNIFIYELKTYRKSVLIWSLAVVAMMLTFMAVYPAFAVDSEMMEKMLESYPEEFLVAFGMTGGLPMSTVAGYFNFIFSFILLSLAVQSSNYGFGFLSVEERELTADFLMSKPISRTKIIASKFSAAFTALLITDIVLFASSFLSIELFREGREYDVRNMMIMLSSTVFFQLYFLSLGMLISVAVKKVRSVLAFSMALSFGMYILNAMRGIFGGVLLGILTPFYHFDGGYILEFGKYNLGHSIISFSVIIVSLTAGYILYAKRNIRSL